MAPHRARGNPPSARRRPRTRAVDALSPSIVATCEDDLRPGPASAPPNNIVADVANASLDESYHFIISSGSGVGDAGTTACVTQSVGSCFEAVTVSATVTASTSSPRTHDVRAPPSFRLKDFEDVSAQLEVAKDEAIEAKKAAAIAQEENVQAQERADVAQNALLQARDELTQARQHLQPLQQRLSEIEDDLHCQVCAQRLRNPVTLACGHTFSVDRFTTQREFTGSKGLMLSLFR
ncbi:hypothetical protein PUNSTDRAFT_139545 [Punctularia strigosozonata HHB-11173 SS5]|uniref:Zinc finger RING-type eukaryotic domain-containing protein n=1 Tax=Punctularia strigosozonata (strain HHB-11173) TaxID=741275 RepID=R7RZB0_PUNST|nr:uncharacterized protein PUNSTDRAFT_139545 [Punctularia strigosozonata HHB-11173 SS5]EIN03455.1 hypothetical protein PUNSTDRAFT_139545 [Punctularia strigosozonata HHB-11173 SS5]